MKPSSAILRKASILLREVADEYLVGFPREREARRLADLLEPTRKIRKVLPFTPRLPEKPNKKLTRKQLVDLVRPEVEKRAGGVCECGCGQPFAKTLVGHATWDEFHGRKHVTVEETWMVRAGCHQQKTENDPTREAWDEKFGAHCRRHDYPFRRRFYRQPLQRRT